MDPTPSSEVGGVFNASGIFASRFRSGVKLPEAAVATQVEYADIIQDRLVKDRTHISGNAVNWLVYLEPARFHRCMGDIGNLFVISVRQMSSRAHSFEESAGHSSQAPPRKGQEGFPKSGAESKLGQWF